MPFILSQKSNYTLKMSKTSVQVSFSIFCGVMFTQADWASASESPDNLWSQWKHKLEDRRGWPSMPGLLKQIPGRWDQSLLN